jgi:hemolysin III
MSPDPHAADVAVARPRPQSLDEERINALSHGIAALLALVATPLLILRAVEVGDAAFVAGVAVFCATAVFLYTASTVYHALPDGRARRVCWLLDHAGIFLLIAGTYTPFTLGVLSGGWGWSLFGIVWGLAGLGVLLKLWPGLMPAGLSTTLYLAMGWVVLVAIGPLMDRVPPAGLAWLVAGGLAYTVGVAFFVLDARVRFAHFVWHLFVVAGTSCHWVAVWGWGAG